LLFGLLILASLGAGCLAIGILVTREPRERGQRALFFLCYGILLTITVAGITFLLNLVRLLDGDRSVSYDAIIGPLIGGYSTLLGFYMAFTLVLPRLMLHDVTVAAISDTEEEEEGGVLDLVSQQLAPPFLVQQSSTLFRRMNTGTMWERYIVGAAPEQQQTPAETELAISDLEAPDAAYVEAEAEGPTVASLDELAGGAATLAAAPPPAIELSEYEALQLEIEAWVRAQQRPPQPQPKPRRGKGSVQAAGLGVPSEIKSKLQRFVALKQLLAAAACGEACGACCTSTPSQLEPLSTPRQQVAPSPAAAPAPLPSPADADPPQSKTERGINVAIRAAACGAAACSPPTWPCSPRWATRSPTTRRGRRLGLALLDLLRGAARRRAPRVRPRRHLLCVRPALLQEEGPHLPDVPPAGDAGRAHRAGRRRRRGTGAKSRRGGANPADRLARRAAVASSALCRRG